MLSSCVEIKTTLLGNNGLFANEKITKGTIIWKLDSSEKQLTKKERDDLPECKKRLAFQYHNKYIVVHDGSQFMNHSCTPNTWWTADDELSAMKDINADEEVTYDYSTADVGNWAASWQCKCGSLDCRKIITGKDILNKKLQEKYQNHLPSWTRDYIKKMTDKKVY